MINIIVASSENNVIGKDNKLLWDLKDDLKRFKDLTKNNTVIMGRKTYESIGKPLPNRVNIVLTRSKKEIKGCIVVNSVKEALNKSDRNKEIFIIGGTEIYNQFLNYCNKIYLTLVHSEFEGDAYFFSEKEILNNKFKEIKRERIEKNNKNEYPFSFIEFKR